MLFMQPLLWLCGEKGVLLIAQAAIGLKWLGVAAARSRADCFIAESVGVFGIVSLPIISSLKSNAVRDHEQGALLSLIHI